MPLSSHHQPRLVLTLAAGLAACASFPGGVAPSTPSSSTRISAPTFTEDCNSYLSTAVAAMAMPDTTPGALPPGHVYGVSMHEYHMCLFRAADARMAAQAPAP